MKKILGLGIMIFLLLGCVNKPEPPQVEPNQEIMKDEQLYHLLSNTIKDQKLLDPLIASPDGYVFWTNGNLKILIINDAMKIEIELQRGYSNKSKTTFTVYDQVFSYDIDNKRREGLFSIWITENQIFVSASDFDHYGYTLSYQEESFKLLDYFAYPTITNVEDFPPVMIDALKQAVKETLRKYDKQIQAMEKAVEVLQDTINQNPTEFTKGSHSSFIMSNEAYNDMLHQMVDAQENQCTYIPTFENQDVLHQTARVIDVSTKDFSNATDAIMNAKMAANILSLSEVYYHHDGDFVSSYTGKKVVGFSISKEVQGDKFYFGVGFLDRFATLQQQLFPGSQPIVLTEEVRVFGYSNLDVYEDYVLFDVPEGDGPTSRRNEMLIVSTKESETTIEVELIFYDTYNQFLLDKDGNTYWYSDCKESESFFESIVSMNRDRFERRKVTFRNQGNRYLEIVSLETLHGA